jgi:uncharacterized protein
VQGLRRFLIWLLGISLLAYALLLVVVGAGQRGLLYRPDANPLRQGEALGAQTLMLQAADGERLVAWWLAPPDAAAPVVLYLHGNGANLDNRAARLQALHEDGAGVLALSWRGYGGSSGEPSEAGWAQDADAAHAWLRAQGIAPARILLFGESLGSTQAVMLAARRPVGALLLDSSFDSALALAQGHYPLIPVSLLMRDPHRADLAAPQLRLPVLQVHCAQDPVSPLARAQALNRLFSPPAQLLVLDDSCHVPSYARYREAARGLLQRMAGR